MVEGYLTPLGIPFKIGDLSDEEVFCTLKRMGIKEIKESEIGELPRILEEEDGDGLICEHCLEEIKDEAFG
jgi:hypothetical protein